MNFSPYYMYIICTYLIVTSISINNVKGYKLLNLNSHIGPFGNCLIQIISYDNLDADFIEFKFPVILANYLVEQRKPKKSDGFLCIHLKTKRKEYFEKEYANYLPQEPNLNCTAFGRYTLRWKIANGRKVAVADNFQYTPYSWQCILHFFLYPMIEDIQIKLRSTTYDTHWAFNQWLVPKFLKWFWNHALEERDEGFHLYEFKETSAICRNEMFVMALEEEEKFKRNMSRMTRWIMESLMYVWFASVHNFKFIFIQEVSLKDFTQNNIYYWQDYTADAKKRRKLINRKLVNAPFTRKSLNEQWKQSDKENLFDIMWLVTQRTHDANNIKQMRNEIKDFGDSLTFKSFHSHKLDTNYALFNELIPNVSLTDQIFKNHELLIYRAKYRKIYTVIKFDAWTDYFVVKSETFKFVTCDGIKMGTGLSFKGFISSFDLAIWLHIIASYFLVLICLKIIYKVKSMQVDLYFTVFPSLLEQGDPVSSNEKRVPSVYFVSGAWILMTIVLSNAYKGNNISELTAPMQIEKIIRFSDLVAENYKLISRCRQCESIYDYEWKTAGYTYTNTLIYNHILLELINNLFNLFSRSQMNDGNFTNRELFLMNATNNLMFANHIGKEKERQYLGTIFPIMFIPKPMGNNTIFDEIIKCNKSAYGDWSDEIDLIEMKLKLMQSDGNMISKSQEGLWKKSTGWTILNTFNPRLKDRLKLFLQYGILQVWKSAARERDLVSQQNRIIRQKHESGDNVKALSTTHNVVVIFYVHLAFIALSAISFCVERLIRRLFLSWKVLKFFISF